MTMLLVSNRVVRHDVVHNTSIDDRHSVRHGRQAVLET